MPSIATNLMVSDVQTSMAFYRDIIGCEVQTRIPQKGEILGDESPDQPIVFATVTFGSSELMMQSRTDFAAEAPGISPDEKIRSTTNIYFRVDEIEELSKRLGDHLVKGPKLTWYGMQEIWALDPDGYLLTFGMPDGAPPAG